MPHTKLAVVVCPEYRSCRMWAQRLGLLLGNEAGVAYVSNGLPSGPGKLRGMDPLATTVYVYRHGDVDEELRQIIRDHHALGMSVVDIRLEAGLEKSRREASEAGVPVG